MKTIFSTIALFSAVLFATSCTEDMEYKDSKVSSVNQLYEPTDGKEVVLQSSASASLFFEWESAKAEDNRCLLDKSLQASVDCQVTYLHFHLSHSCQVWNLGCR